MSRKGYTLIELLVVIAIMGILSTMAMVNFNTYLDNRKLDSEAYKLHSFISGYKVESYKTEKPYYFRLGDGSASSFTILNVYDDNTAGASAIDSYDITHNADMPIEKRAMATGVKMSIDKSSFNTSSTISVDPLSLGYKLPNEDDSLKLVINHSSIEGVKYTITFYHEQARVRFDKNDKDL